MKLRTKAEKRLKSRLNIPFWFPKLFKKKLIRANYRKLRKHIRKHGTCSAIVEGLINRLLRQDAMVVVEEEWLNEKIKEIGTKIPIILDEVVNAEKRVTNIKFL